jgi:hypothetical protein
MELASYLKQIIWAKSVGRIMRMQKERICIFESSQGLEISLGCLASNGSIILRCNLKKE